MALHNLVGKEARAILFQYDGDGAGTLSKAELARMGVRGAAIFQSDADGDGEIDEVCTTQAHTFDRNCRLSLCCKH